MAHPFGLYYPYIHVRDEAWIRLAALYWPRLVRFRPPDHPLRDSPTARTLRDELDWIRDLDPGPAVSDVEEPFQTLLLTHESALRERFAVVGGSAFEDLGLPLEFVHQGQVSPGLARQMEDAGLALPIREEDGVWLGMNRDLLVVYMCALAERAAARNRLHPMTDQLLPHAAVSGWDVERLADVLLDKPLATRTRVSAAGEPLDMFALMAIETVVPDSLAQVPITKIIELRTRHQPELDDFRDYVTTQVERLADLRGVDDPQVYLDYMREEIQHGVRQRLNELDKQVRSAGLTPVRALGSLKAAVPPGVATATAAALNLNAEAVAIAAGSAVAAASLIRLPGNVRRVRRDAVRSSPVGYLFQVRRELTPASMVDRVLRALRGS